MGMWVTSGNIARLIAKLDWKFGDIGMARIRANPGRIKRFNGTLKLHQIARLFRIWPGGPNAGGAQNARYWYGFLRWLHTQPNAASNTGTKVADDIIQYMRDAIGDPSCRAMNFVAIEGSDVRVTTSVLAAPSNIDAQAYVQTILLQTIEHGTDDESPPSSGGQDPVGEDIPDPTTTALRRKHKKRITKKAAKKAQKKAAKKKL